METKESKETELKELSDKDLQKVSGGKNVCSDALIEGCMLQGGTYDMDSCVCIFSWWKIGFGKGGQSVGCPLLHFVEVGVGVDVVAGDEGVDVVFGVEELVGCGDLDAADEAALDQAVEGGLGDLKKLKGFEDWEVHGERWIVFFSERWSVNGQYIGIGCYRLG